MKRFLLYLSLTAFLLSACKETRNQKIANFLNSLKIEENSSISILNPDFCGSCTDFSIKWLAKTKTQSKSKIVLLTGDLKESYRSQLSKAHYKFLNVDQNKLARNGIIMNVCTFIELKNGEVKSIITVK